MTPYTSADFQLFTQVPAPVLAALSKGEITFWQFLILIFWHKRADRYTGVVSSFRAEMILNWLEDADHEPFREYRLPAIKTLRGHVRGLREAGWCHSGYVQGSNKPYDVTLCNFRPCRAAHDELGDEKSKRPEKNLFAGREDSNVAGCDVSVLNPSKLKHWKNTSLFRGRDNYSSGGREENLVEGHEGHANTQNAGLAFGVGQENKEHLPVQEINDTSNSREAGLKLRRALAQVSSEVLRNTRLVPQNMYFKFELIAQAHGHDAVVADFTTWCREHIADQHQYPITEYVRVVDARLGSVPEEKKPNLNDSNVKVLAALSYELTGRLAPKKAIARLLLMYSADEIKAAITEYAENLTEKEVKGAMRRFWADGGGAAVILARRGRHGKVA